MPKVGDRVELELFDPARNAARRYAVSVLADPQLPLYEGEPPAVLLVVVRGRVGHRPIVRRQRFATLAELAVKWRLLLRRRELHGYTEVER